MCNVLNVSRSGYYAWTNRKTSKRELENKVLVRKIRLIYQQSKQTYGSPRITQELKNQNIDVSRQRVARLMKKENIYSMVKKRYIVTTNSKHKYPVAPNLVERNFNVLAPGQVWVSDITYIKVQSRWVYLTVVIDLYDRKVIGWHLSNSMKATHTTIPALNMAIKNRDRLNTLIFHSDRGVQYACNEFKLLLKQYKIIQSMSRKGDCWDNAVAESFFKTIKTECTNRYSFNSFLKAKIEIFKYIEIWYNRQRLHSALGYKTPLEMEIYFYKLIA